MVVGMRWLQVAEKTWFHYCFEFSRNEGKFSGQRGMYHTSTISFPVQFFQGVPK